MHCYSFPRGINNTTRERGYVHVYDDKQIVSVAAVFRARWADLGVNMRASVYIYNDAGRRRVKDTAGARLILVACV